LGELCGATRSNPGQSIVSAPFASRLVGDYRILSLAACDRLLSGFRFCRRKCGSG
jgi:hypothetical protein